MKKNYKGIINSIEKIAKDTFKISIKSSLEIAKSGQFISILCDNKTMRRPFSIADFIKQENFSILTIIFKLKGEGTLYISSLKVNDTIEFLAPLGNGFNLKNKKALLIGAGIGIAPMLFLKKELNQKSIKNYLISGFKAQEEVISGSDETLIGGSVLDNLEEIIKKQNIEIIYACGPYIVLKLLSQTAQKFNLEFQAAMEKTMACSIGVCRGCVIKLIKDNKIENHSICKDGPVFLGNEVLWE